MVLAAVPPELWVSALVTGVASPTAVVMMFVSGKIRWSGEVEGWKERALAAEAAVQKLTDASIEKMTPALVQATGALERVMGVMERVMDALVSPPQRRRHR